MEWPLSHPPHDGEGPTYLDDHLEEVADRAATVVGDDARTVGDEPVSCFVRVLGRCHDVGKATTWFQTHIDPEGGTPSGPTEHALFGAYLTYFSLERLEFDALDCLAGFVAVAKHHGRLPDTDDYVEYAARVNPRNPRENEHLGDVIRQVQNVDEHRGDLLQRFMTEVTDGSGSWEEFRSVIVDGTLFDTVYEHVDEHSFESGRPRPGSGFYETVIQGWSGLVFADKTSAAGIPEDAYAGREPDEAALVEHIHELQNQQSSSGLEETLNDARAEARRSVLTGVDDVLDGDSSVATLTLPTGLGKTLTGLNAAFQIRDANDGGRVIYALPFTSIIDQVSAEIEDIFDVDPKGKLLTIHHYLSETRTTLSDEDDSADESQPTDADARLETMVAESWRSGITVTTFVQLFESLAGPGNTQSMKLPSLYDSVVVLDEPQAIPTDWWKLVRRMVDVLRIEYNATVIAMTATQPQLFEDSVELVDSPREYFERFERVQYRLDPSVWEYSEGEPVDYDGAAARILEFLGSERPSALAVCNTIDSAITLTNAIEALAEPVAVGSMYADWLDGSSSIEEFVDGVEESCSADSFALVHLTSRIRPIDRLRLISAIKELTEREVPLVVVSTQIIEAGVDVSFSTVFRDLAPIDSVVQAAGRCNRSFERDIGTVALWWLSPPDGTTTSPAAAVYDRHGVSTASITVQTLESVAGGEMDISESTLTTDGVRTYYERLRERDPGNERYVSYVDDAAAEQLGALSLIDTPRSIDVVVCRTEGDRETVEGAQRAFETGNVDELNELRRSLAELTVSIPVYDVRSSEAEALEKLESLIPGDADRLVLDTDQTHLASYFDSTTGLVPPDTTVDARIL